MRKVETFLSLKAVFNYFFMIKNFLYFRKFSISKTVLVTINSYLYFFKYLFHSYYHFKPRGE